MAEKHIMTEKEFSDGGFKEINKLLFQETEDKDSGKDILAGLTRDIGNITNTETSNGIFMQLGRVEQIKALANALLEHCEEAEETLKKVK